MGSVKTDIHKAEHQYRRITLSDVDCIKGLIKNRSSIDQYMGMEANYNESQAGDCTPLNQELIAAYVDLDELLKKVKLSEKQKVVINRLMQGWTEDDIAEDFSQKKQKIKNILDTVCDKIKKANDLNWKYNYVYMNYKKGEWEYKECGSCGEVKPAIEEFFSINKRSPDGLNSICKDCR